MTGTLDSPAAATVERSESGPPLRPGEALRAHWPIVLASVVVFVALAVVLGMRRQPEYTAQARLSVGRIFVDNAAAVPGVLQASQSLASNYSRAIGATAVVRRARQLAGVNDGSIAATPLPGSTLITVSGRAGSARSAIRLANAGSAALIEYVGGQSHTGLDAQVALTRFRYAALNYQRRVEAATELKRTFAADPTSVTQDDLDRASAAVQAARLRRDAVASAYQTLVEGATSSPTLEPFSRATGAASDRRRKLEILVFIGLVAGLAVGGALAMVHITRRAARPTSAG